MHRTVPCKSFECQLGCNSRLPKMARATTSPPQTPLSAPPPISSSPSPEQHQINDWISVQDELKRRLVIEDNFDWALPDENGEDEGKEEVLRYVGGVDVSFSTEDSAVACGCIVVLDVEAVEVVYEDYCVTRLEVPYVAGFLAFREVPVLLGLLRKMKTDSNPFYPQLLMVDGNGLLHPRGSYLNGIRHCRVFPCLVFIFLLLGSLLRQTCAQGFGLACHLGVLADIPTIGVGKNLHHMDGLTRINVGELLQHDSCRELVDLIGSSGHTLGVAMRSTLSTLKPIFISVGHRISLATAVKVVKLSCKYRVPEPIRQNKSKAEDARRIDAEAVIVNRHCLHDLVYVNLLAFDIECSTCESALSASEAMSHKQAHDQELIESVFPTLGILRTTTETFIAYLFAHKKLLSLKLSTCPVSIDTIIEVASATSESSRISIFCHAKI
ncbi:Endonuclease V-like protein [Drosera capensis]